jgi:anti-sigma regulatory factor (Ser/Thr protein kinase)
MVKCAPFQRPAPSAAWWGRDFRGDTAQVSEARRWIEDLLPDCDPLADVLLLTSELCANAVVHTRSGEPGGRFSVDVEWTPASARIVIGDQGSPKVPAIRARTVTTNRTDESGRGLRLVDELADDWGTASRLGHRWVWADIAWGPRGGPPLDAPGGADAATGGIKLIRKAFPGTAIWWGYLTRAWWAAVPGAADAGGLIASSTQEGLIRALADVYPKFLAIASGGGLQHCSAIT